MKLLLLGLFFIVSYSIALANPQWTIMGEQLSLDGALQVAKTAQAAARKLNKNISLAVVGSQGETILIFKGDGVGPHNTEAARRKAYTSLSTKTSTLSLLRMARKNPDTSNLAELPELLLLSGGCPIVKNGAVIGAIGVAGGGSPENDDFIAAQAQAALVDQGNKK